MERNTQVSVIYTAEVTSSGDGRNGIARSDDGLLDLALTSPKEVGGSGAGTNPEQLFAAGYAACFHSALRLSAREAGVGLPDSTITAVVRLERGDDGFHLSADLTARLPGLDLVTAERLAARAHERCPYSKATRGNILVAVHVDAGDQQP